MTQSWAVKKLEYTALERIPRHLPCDRIDFITQLCRGKYVLDLGAFDENAWALKRSHGSWLHDRIAQVAGEVLGVDNSDALPAEGFVTGPRSVIRRGDVYQLSALPLDRKPDVVVIGELIEHLPNGVEFLAKLKNDGRFTGSTLVLTTPNACAAHNVVLGLFSRESMDRGHLAIYSYKTLTTVFQLAGFESFEIRPYYARFPEMIARSTKLSRLGVIGFQSLMNGLERIAPLLSGGWIVTATL